MGGLKLFVWIGSHDMSYKPYADDIYLMPDMFCIGQIGSNNIVM